MLNSSAIAPMFDESPWRRTWGVQVHLLIFVELEQSKENFNKLFTSRFPDLKWHISDPKKAVAVTNNIKFIAMELWQSKITTATTFLALRCKSSCDNHHGGPRRRR